MLTVMLVFVGTSKAVQNHPLRAALSLINPIHSLIEGPNKRALLCGSYHASSYKECFYRQHIAPSARV